MSLNQNKRSVTLTLFLDFWNLSLWDYGPIFRTNAQDEKASNKWSRSPVSLPDSDSPVPPLPPLDRTFVDLDLT